MPVVDQSSPVTTSEQQAVPVAQIDWRDPIGVLPLGGGPLIPAVVVAGPDMDGDYRVSFRDKGNHGYIRGLQWFRDDGTACGATGHRVIQARWDAASLPCKSGEGAGEGRKDTDFAWVVPRHATDGMMNAGLYHCSADMAWADLFTAFHYMVDEAQQDDRILALTPDATQTREAEGGADCVALVMGWHSDWQQVKGAHHDDGTAWPTALDIARRLDAALNARGGA